MQFTVPGRPIGKGRPRVVNSHAYTPERTREHEASIATLARNAMALADIEPYTKPVRVHLWFYLPDHRNEPDIDNLIKAALDGCNGVVYADDKQVDEIHAWKLYSEKQPRTEIAISDAPVIMIPDPKLSVT